MGVQHCSKSNAKARANAASRLAAYNQWEQNLVGFLDGQSRYGNGGIEDTHQRLVKARRMIHERIGERHMSAFPGDKPTRDGAIPATNNLIEPCNTPLLRTAHDPAHQSHPLVVPATRRNTCNPSHDSLPTPSPPSTSKTSTKKAWGSDLQGACESYGIINRYGTVINRNEFHTTTPYPNETNQYKDTLYDL